MKQLDFPEFDNMLVRQKDAILRLVNDGRLTEAQAALNVVAPLWEAATYGYKTREIQERIKKSQA